MTDDKKINKKKDFIKIDDKLDSVKVYRNVAGKYSFEVKRYYDQTKEKASDIIESIEEVYAELDKRFRHGETITPKDKKTVGGTENE